MALEATLTRLPGEYISARLKTPAISYFARTDFDRSCYLWWAKVN